MCEGNVGQPGRQWLTPQGVPRRVHLGVAAWVSWVMGLVMCGQPVVGFGSMVARTIPAHPVLPAGEISVTRQHGSRVSSTICTLLRSNVGGAAFDSVA